MQSKAFPKVNVKAVEIEGMPIYLPKQSVEMMLAFPMNTFVFKRLQLNTTSKFKSILGLKFPQETGNVYFSQNTNHHLVSFETPLLSKNSLMKLGIHIDENIMFPLRHINIWIESKDEIHNCTRFIECYNNAFYELSRKSSWKQSLLNFAVEQHNTSPSSRDFDCNSEVIINIEDPEEGTQEKIEAFVTRKGSKRTKVSQKIEIPSTRSLGAAIDDYDFWLNDDEIVYGLIKAFESFDTFQRNQIQLYDTWVYLYMSDHQKSQFCLRENFVEKKYHVFPCYYGQHWFLSIVEFLHEQHISKFYFKIWIYDSITNDVRAQEAEDRLSSHIIQGLRELYPDLDQMDIKYECAIVANAWKQKDGFNCGPFTIMNAIKFFEERGVSSMLGNIGGPNNIREFIRATKNHQKEVEMYFSKDIDNAISLGSRHKKVPKG